MAPVSAPGTSPAELPAPGTTALPAPGTTALPAPGTTALPAPGTTAWRACVAPAAIASAAAGLATVAALVDPFKHHLTPTCPFRALTGLWCPFCGGTRAVWAAAHGDFRLMIHANALMPAVGLLLAWKWLSWLGQSTGWWRLPVPGGRGFGVAVAVVLIGFAVLRNLPGFGALAPPVVA